MASPRQSQVPRKKLWEKPETDQDGGSLEVFDACQYGKLQLPEELKDEQQAAIFYSPFREKSVNPRGWARKLEFWERFLSKTASERNIISFSANTLPTLYQRRGITPKCLATVIEELVKSGKLKKYDNYIKNESWLSWGFNSLVKQPLSWGVTHLMGSPITSTAGSEVYVWPDVVEKVANEIMAIHHNNVKHESSDCVMSLATFRSQCMSQVKGDENFDILLTHLQRQEKIKVKEMEDGNVLIKICKLGERTAISFKDTDIQVYRISSTQRKLEEDIETLSSKIDLLYEEARANVKLGKKTLATHCLRKKKALQKILDRRSACIIRLEDIINKIEEAKTNEMVVNACEDGVAALKALNSTFDLDKVETVMDQVQETLEDQEEINQTLRASEPTHLRDLDDGLEAELEALLTHDTGQPDGDVKGQPDGEVKSQGQQVQSSPLNESLDLKFSSLTVDDIGLPNVPAHSPRGSSTSVANDRHSKVEALPS